MKRTSLSFLALCCFLMAVAEPIGKQAALFTARSYMLEKGKNISPNLSGPRKGAAQQTEDSYYYVFNAGNDGGYVIVSGDDRVEPILGYVEQGSFDPDNIPENMRSWLQLYADQIKYIIDNNIQPGDPLIKKRNKAVGTKHSVPELMKSRWNQGMPYNLTCPDYYTDKDNDVHHYPASGCAATAMAQVINYYKYPAKLKAQIPSHSKEYTLKNGTKKTVTVPAVPRNTKIDWENMRDTYSCNKDHVHDAPDTAVANLMLYCGQSLKMGWGASSGADTSKSRDALVNYFGFDARAYWASRPSYGIDEWFDMLYDEMEAGYPVLYRGHSSGGGHAFVIDGFDGDNLFHVNWGWGGGSNGWFLISILNPGDTSGMGASSSSDGYSMTQGGVFNLRLPNSPKGDAYLKINEVKINGSKIEAKFTNRTGATNSFHTGIVMLQEDGSLALVGSKLTATGLANGSSVTKTFLIANKLPEGTYRLSPASKSTKSEEWRAEYDFQNQYILAVVDSTGSVYMQFFKPIPTNEDIKVDTIVFPGTRIQKKEQEVKVTFKNDGAEYFKTVYLFASKTQTKVYTDSKSMVAVRSGETVDVSYFFTPDTTGTYNLWLCTDDKGNNVIGQGSMEIITEAEATRANLTILEYKISNLVGEIAYGNRLIGKATIRNNGSLPYRANVKLQLWSQKIGSNTAYSGTTRSYPVDIAPGKTGTIDFEFSGLSEGYYYRFKATYSTQDGTLGSGGIWDHKWEVKGGALTWKADGTVAGKAYNSSMVAGTTTIGLYACCNKITRLTPNRNNANTIYAFDAGMEVPANLDGYNTVAGSHAENINLINDKAYYIPTSFDADSASFTYTFSETEDGSKWHAFTMPFEVDSILVDSIPVSLKDALNHFWIYEFTAEDGYGRAVFGPATQLRGGTPYIIAGDAKMAGRSIVFRSLNAHFYKTGSDKMLVTSSHYKFHGNTYSPKVKGCYILNAEGTAFEYTAINKVLGAMASYFTTTFPDSVAPTSIVLPDIPVQPIKEVTLDEMALETESTIVADTYDKLTLKRTFEAGLNTICLPFQVDSIGAIFGQDAQAYEFYSFYNNRLNFVKVDTLSAGVPYIIVLPEAISEDIVLEGITIDEENVHPGFISKDDASFRGTYHSITSDMFSMKLHKLMTDGTIVEFGPDEIMNGFRAVFYVPTDEDVTLCLIDDDVTSIQTIGNNKQTTEIYNLAGQRINRAQKGIHITNGKKIYIR